MCPSAEISVTVEDPHTDEATRLIAGLCKNPLYELIGRVTIFTARY